MRKDPLTLDQWICHQNLCRCKQRKRLRKSIQQPENCNLYVVKTKTWKICTSPTVFPSSWILPFQFLHNKPRSKTMRFRLCLDCRHKNTLKNPENGCFLTKTTVFHGPSGEIRTPGILNPNQAPYQLGHTRIFTSSFCAKWSNMWSNSIFCRPWRIVYGNFS